MVINEFYETFVSMLQYCCNRRKTLWFIGQKSLNHTVSCVNTMLQWQATLIPWEETLLQWEETMLRWEENHASMEGIHAAMGGKHVAV